MSQTPQSPPLPSAPDLAPGQRWRFADGREGVVAAVRPRIEARVYVGPELMVIPEGDLWAAFLGATRLPLEAAQPTSHAASLTAADIAHEEASARLQGDAREVALLNTARTPPGSAVLSVPTPDAAGTTLPLLSLAGSPGEALAVLVVPAEPAEPEVRDLVREVAQGQVAETARKAGGKRPRR